MVSRCGLPRVNFKKIYRTSSIFYMLIDIGEMIAGKQYLYSVIILTRRATQAPSNGQKFTFFHIVAHT